MRSHLLPVMDWTFGIALLVGFAPVFVMMDVIMKNYTYPRVETPFFKDSTFFMMLVVGILEGAALMIVTQFFGLLDSPFAILYMVIMALIELMAMVVVMNLKRFRGKSDSIFYGYGLGLGMAGGMASGFAYMICMAALNNTVVDYPAVATYIILLSVSMTFIFGSSGTNIGEGIARHLPMQFVLQAAVPLVAYNMLFGALWMDTNLIMFYALLIAMVAVGAFFFYRNLMVNLPAIIREVLKMNGERRDDIPKSR
jgi:hypothetical protein